MRNRREQRFTRGVIYTKTRVTLRLEYEPEGFFETVGSALGFVDSRVEGDLERFKKFIEGHGAETGGWRGEIHRGTERPANNSMLPLG